MIDKNGKLFGKVNLIDLIIVLVIIAAVAFVGLKVVNRADSGSTLSPVRISFFAEEAPSYVADALKVDTSVLDMTENVTIGTVESFDVGDPIGYFTDTKGQVQSVVRDGYNSITLQVLANGELSEHGVTINGVLYGVGHTLTIYAGKAKIYLRVSGIEPIA